MRLLVTGGAGFIGSNFVRYMLQKYPNYQIVSLDALTYAGNLANLSDAGGDARHTFVRGDICDKDLVEALFSGVSTKDHADTATDEGRIGAVVHFAAESHVDRSIMDPGVFVQTNVSGTQVLLEAARSWQVKKFVHVSTDEVYGSLTDTGQFKEDSPMSPNSPYAASKAGADMMVRAYHHTYGVPAVITRCTNNYGPRQHPEKLIPMVVTHALANDPIPVYGNGLQVRDWLHVLDHCSAIDLALHRAAPGTVYNVGANNEHTNLEVVRLILDWLGKPKRLIRLVPDRPGHDTRYALDASKLRADLGWKPAIPFPSGLKQTVQWYVDHRTWWEGAAR